MMNTWSRGAGLVLALAATLAGASVASAKSKKAEPYKEMAKDDIGADAAAQAAVAQKSTKLKEGLKLGEVVKAESIEGKGMNMKYRLCLKTIAGSGAESFVQTVVTVDNYTNYKIVSWAASKCGK